MKKSKVLLISLILMVCSTSAFASVYTRPSISSWFGGVFCHPTADYLKEYPGNDDVEMPAIRTSSSFGFDFNVLNFTIDLDNAKGTALNVDLGMTYFNVSRSIRYGVSVLKPYTGFGFVAGVGYCFDPSWALDLRYRFMGCKFTDSNQRFVAMELELDPSFRFESADIFDFRVSLPVADSYKADAISLRASVEFTIALDLRGIVEGGRK